MIYRLQRKFILISGISLVAVFGIIFAVICVMNVSSTTREMDRLTDVIASHDGTFPRPEARPDAQSPDPEEREQRAPFDFDIERGASFNREAPFTTRYFTVWFESGEITEASLDSISSVTQEEAYGYAEKAVAKRGERGWLSGFRYKLFDTESGQAVVFVDGSMSLSVSYGVIASVGGVLFGSGLVILLLIVVFSRRAVTPAAESYEKQKQFITDANHELKTPLTLILTNLDIAESQVGKNEWLEDIRSEGERMTQLVDQLVTLSRMDEEKQRPDHTEFSLSEAVSDTVFEFRHLAERAGKRLNVDLESGIRYTGNEEAVRKLLSILMDNAVKYCDEGGEICVSFGQKRHPVLKVENSYRDAGAVELDRLFDRFYRADKARTYMGGFGIGLSIAKAIAAKHNSEISANRKGEDRIGFKVVFKKR